MINSNWAISVHHTYKAVGEYLVNTLIYHFPVNKRAKNVSFRQNAQITHKAQDLNFPSFTFGSFNHKINKKNDEQQGKDQGRDKVRLKTTRCLLGVW